MTLPDSKPHPCPEWCEIPRSFLLFLDMLGDAGFDCEKFGSDDDVMIFRREVEETDLTFDEVITVDLGDSAEDRPVTMKHSLENYDEKNPYPPEPITLDYDAPLTSLTALRISYARLRSFLADYLHTDEPPIDGDR